MVRGKNYYLKRVFICSATSSTFGVSDLSKHFDPEDFDRRMKEVYKFDTCKSRLFRSPSSFFFCLNRFSTKNITVQGKLRMKNPLGIPTRSNFEPNSRPPTNSRQFTLDVLHFVLGGEGNCRNSRLFWSVLYAHTWNTSHMLFFSCIRIRRGSSYQAPQIPKGSTREISQSESQVSRVSLLFVKQLPCPCSLTLFHF